MSPRWKERLRWTNLWPVVGLLLLALIPILPVGRSEGHWLTLQDWLSNLADRPIGSDLSNLFIYCIVALGLNVVVGYTGLLHLGIAAFFGIGAYLTGILTIAANPFHWGFLPTVAAATLGAAAAGIVLGAPTLRLTGDYLALVTLGFGEVVRFTLRNLEELTGGTKGLSPVPPPTSGVQNGGAFDWAGDYRLFYYLLLAALVLVLIVLRNLERSRSGRSWMALREDELAASCMGINPLRVKMVAFALGAGLAGLAGCLYAYKFSGTQQPDTYDFNHSITFLCCIILGGLGSLRGTVIGVFLLLGFDNILAPILDAAIQHASANNGSNPLLTFNNWRFLMFGLALILMMRFRPEGLFPSRTMQEELHRG
ncbi:MAG TPA: branched-chain amino acid ABC transporter permease [Pirellulales bacterium]|jgi:branched-chain amino acid transport system permease protein|nr:branched-chain amino acid ABC transporter permease [Pirellulales bacterium]